MIRNLLRINLLSIYVLLASCSERASFSTLSPIDFKARMNQSHAQLLDVRTIEEHIAGNIPGSINIDVLQEGTFLSKADSLLDKRHPVALYCRSGKRSKVAASFLIKAGYKVFELDGGFNAWKGQNAE